MTPNCAPPPPPPPPPVDPPCSGDPAGVAHAWPCPAQSTRDCAYAAVSFTDCPAVTVTVRPVGAAGVATPGASTPAVDAPVPNLYNYAWRLPYNATDCAADTMGGGGC
jgi:hypothetical protein